MAGYISNDTTVYSNVSLTGNLNASRVAASSYSMGGTPFSLSVASFNVVAQVVQGSASTFTVCATVTGVKKGDILNISPLGGAGVSSISSGLVYHSHCTQDGQFEFRYSNVSTLAQNQSAQVFNLAIIRPL
jgi:hypothetical protein